MGWDFVQIYSTVFWIVLCTTWKTNKNTQNKKKNFIVRFPPCWLEIAKYLGSKLMFRTLLVKLTWDVPAMSTPASRKLLKSCPNLLVALARSWVVPLEAWTTSLADWFRPAATSLRWAWTSWKLLPLDGNYSKRRRKRWVRVLPDQY